MREKTLGLTTEEMSTDDLEVAFEIEKECFSPDEAFSKDKYRRLLKSPTSIKIKALVSGATVGFGIGLVRNGEAEIYTINVRRQFRRQGIATTLIRALERSFLRHRCKIVVAEVSPANKPSKQLFKVLGYQETRIIPNFYKPGRSAIQVEKRLRLSK